MAQVKVSGVPGFDGEYELDQEKSFNGDELHLIKKVAGVRLGEISEALKAGDYDLIIAITAIAMWRAGQTSEDTWPELVKQLLHADAGAITITEEADASPPPPAPSGPGSNGAQHVSSPPSSEVSSSTGGDRPVTTPASTGSRS